MFSRYEPFSEVYGEFCLLEQPPWIPEKGCSHACNVNTSIRRWFLGQVVSTGDSEGGAIGDRRNCGGDTRAHTTVRRRAGAGIRHGEDGMGRRCPTESPPTRWAPAAQLLDC